MFCAMAGGVLSDTRALTRRRLRRGCAARSGPPDCPHHADTRAVPNSPGKYVFYGWLLRWCRANGRSAGKLVPVSHRAVFLCKP
jgi:hypothetical protein